MPSTGHEVSTTLCKGVKGVTFEIVVRAMDFSNIPSAIGDEADKFVRENGLADVPHIFMATHSTGGRYWEVVEGRTPAFFDDEATDDEGWYIFRNEDVQYLLCSSATSDSLLTAVKQKDGTWDLLLGVPVDEEGHPYRGNYWHAFHKALGLSDEEPRAETSVEKPVKPPLQGPVTEWEAELLVTHAMAETD